MARTNKNRFCLPKSTMLKQRIRSFAVRGKRLAAAQHTSSEACDAERQLEPPVDDAGLSSRSTSPELSTQPKGSLPEETLLSGHRPSCSAHHRPSMSSMLEQPSWWQRQMLDYLDPCDALSFAATSRRARVTSVRLVPSASLVESNGNWEGNYRGVASRWQALKIPRNSGMTHTVLVRGRWRDQGWGCRKGMLSVVRQGGHAPRDFKPRSDDVVAWKEPAPHEWGSIVLSFRPKAQVEYELWQRAGGGGVHMLLVENLEMRKLVYMDTDAN